MNFNKVENKMRIFDKIATIQDYGGDFSQCNNTRNSDNKYKYWERIKKIIICICYYCQLGKNKIINPQL